MSTRTTLPRGYGGKAATRTYARPHAHAPAPAHDLCRPFGFSRGPPPRDTPKRPIFKPRDTDTNTSRTTRARRRTYIVFSRRLRDTDVKSGPRPFTPLRSTPFTYATFEIKPVLYFQPGKYSLRIVRIVRRVVVTHKKNHVVEKPKNFKQQRFRVGNGRNIFRLHGHSMKSYPDTPTV